MKSIVSFKAYLGALLALLFVAPAYAGYDLGGSSSGPFGKLTEWLQWMIDFMDGPMGLAMVVGGLVVGCCVWIFAPKGGAVGFMARCVAAGIVVLNIGTWVASFV